MAQGTRKRLLQWTTLFTTASNKSIACSNLSCVQCKVQRIENSLRGHKPQCRANQFSKHKWMHKVL